MIDERLEKILAMREAGKSAREIGAEVGLTRDAVLGKIHRFMTRDAPKRKVVALRTNNETFGRYRDEVFVEKFTYRTPRKIDMGPIVRAALAAIEARRVS